MEELRQIRLRLKPETVAYLEEFADDKRFGHLGQVIDHITEEHRQLADEKWDMQFLTRSISAQVSRHIEELVDEQISTELERIRLAANRSDRHGQILTELLQALMQTEGIEDIMTTDQFKPTFIETAEHVVQERIEHQKQKKDTITFKRG
ncbi:hypothetical protein [Exiguobacterium sp. s142]|uniref:hypothetical protein n=1 Tax=Exiguobacterium sp. s142 TaxID=2751222 RepID=UPI001BE87C21|nr:hypothetical protein [Exiguobacterium sp. s142]